jgi:hypothetical protein
LVARAPCFSAAWVSCPLEARGSQSKRTDCATIHGPVDRDGAQDFPRRVSAHAGDAHLPLTDGAQLRGNLSTVRRKVSWGVVRRSSQVPPLFPTLDLVVSVGIAWT